MRRDVLVESKAAAYTVTEEDSGKVFLATAADVVFTLPDSVSGLYYTFITHTVSSGTGTSISPSSTEAIHYITSANDKDLINSGATDVEGDSVTIVGDGSAGWWVTSIDGTWAKEA